MFANLAATGVVPLCVPEIVTSNCISQRLMNDLAPLTFKITGNTSGGTPSMTGTAATSSSTNAAQPVTVNAAGSKGPDFAGVTMQYAFFSKNSVAAKALNTASVTTSGAANTYLTAVTGLLKTANQTQMDIEKCDAYQTWTQVMKSSGFQGTVEDALDAKAPAESDDELGKDLAERYSELLTSMATSKLSVCQTALSDFNGLFAAIQKARALEDIEAQQANKKPVFALEYDLNTPQGKPAYSTAKGTLTWSWGASGKAAPVDPKSPGTQPLCEAIRTVESSGQPSTGAANTKSGDPCETLGSQNTQKQQTKGGSPTLGKRQKAFLLYAEARSSPETPATPIAKASMLPSPTAAAKSAANAAAKPLSVTLTASGDFYNAEPPTTIPSATHVRDMQAGGEVAYLFAPSVDSGSLRTAIGDITLAGGYSYQDQTSPAILTGPALTDFTGLPTSTTTAYAKRGVIHLAQVKLGIGSGTNISYPLAFTYSNRTELITHPTWGLQFGITYNLNSLFTSSK
jgi:hypothetical protein